jgi:hypothetical protein
MAQQVITTILRTDDLDGTELGEKGNTIEFVWEGKSYAIDLSDKNAEKFRTAMGQYVEHARTVQREQQHSGRGHGRRTSAGSNPEVKEARAWLIQQGVLRPESRGRIKSEHMEMYRKRGIPSQQTRIDTSSTTSTTSDTDKAPAANAQPAKTAPAKASAPAKKAEPAKATA